MKKELVALVTVAMLTLAPMFIGATFGNGTKGFWDVTSDPVLKYKSSLTLKFKMQDDYNFANFNAFEIYMEDANTTPSINTTFLNECFTKTITVNSAKTEVTIKLTSDTIFYQDAVDNGLDADIYYLWVDLRKLGDTNLALDTFKATPLKIKWNLNELDLSTGGGWKPLSPELKYKSSVTMTFEGYQDQFEFKNEFPCDLNIMGLDTEIQQNYFHITDVTKVNDRTIRVTVTSTQIYADDLLEKSIQRKYYQAKVEFTDPNIPDKEFQIDLNSLPTYSTNGGTDYVQLVADLNAEITALNAEIASLESQVGTSTDGQTELAELRALKNTVVSQLFAYGITTTTSSAGVATTLTEVTGYANQWKKLEGLGYADGNTLYTDFTLFKAQAQNPTCPSTQCNYTNWVQKSTYDDVVEERNGLELAKADIQTELDNARKENYTWAIAGGVIMLIVGILMGRGIKPKNGNRRPPVPMQPQSTIKPHKHKGGLPPQSAQRKKKEYIGRD